MKSNAAMKDLTAGKPRNNVRQKMLGFIHVNFPRLRPDLRHSTEDMKEARLAFCTEVLGLRAPLVSCARLHNRQLEKVIEAIKRQLPQERLPGVEYKRDAVASVNSRPKPTSCTAKDMRSGEVIHLAGNEQVWAIERVIEHLGWSPEGTEEFFQNQFKVSTPKMLKTKAANTALYVLLRSAAWKALRAEKGKDAKIDNETLNRRIRIIKMNLGIKG